MSADCARAVHAKKARHRSWTDNISALVVVRAMSAAQVVRPGRRPVQVHSAAGGSILCCLTPAFIAARLSSHAWRLAAATAVACFTAFFTAVGLSFVLRPTRTYLFPLLKDVDAFHPESAVLRTGAVLTTALLIATTAATCGLVNGYCLTETCSEAYGAPRKHSTSEKLPVEEIWSESEDVELHISSNLTRSPLHVSLSQSHSQGREAPENSLETQVPSHLCTHQDFRFRLLAFGRRNRRTLIVAAILVTAGMLVIAQVFEVPAALATFSPWSESYVKSPIVLYICGALWVVLLCFLISYFLKLQATAEFNSDECQGGVPITTESDRAARVVFLARKFIFWLVEMLRPMCLTAQLVSVLKIIGLVYALKSFSISKIFLIKIALLAALAFAEYTAAFFLSFFLVILAVDMKRLAADDAWRSRLKSHSTEHFSDLSLPTHGRNVVVEDS